MLEPPVTANTLNVGIVGVTGAMGRRLVHVLAEFPHLKLAAVLTREGGESRARAVLGDAVGVMVTPSLPQFAAAIDVAIDFSAPPQCAALAPHLTACRCAYIVASTGLDGEGEAALDAMGQQVPVLQAANLSLGVQVLTALAEQAAAALPHWDVDIVEVHHRRKVDGPSGTALALGAAAQRGAAVWGAELHPHVGRGAQPPSGRPAQELGYSVVRGGDVPGEHTLFLFGDGERLELTHRSQSADIFARGALGACARLRAARAGRYTMHSLPPHTLR